MKRVLLFVLLLSLGFVLLRLATGGEGFATASGVADRPRVRAEDTAPDAIRLQQGGTELQVRGGFSIAPTRSVPLPGGGVRFQPIYELTCADCVPIDGQRSRLDDVVMKLFDQGEHVADLTATHALVELDVDRQNHRSLRENKDIELEDAVVAARPGARMGAARIEVARVRARVTDTEITLRTPDENALVRVVVDGERKGELTGRGLRAQLPKDRTQPGRLDLLLLHEPTITMAGVDLRAQGQLHYVEQLDTGAAVLQVADDVHVDLTAARGLGDAQGAARRVDVHGDRLHGWLQRTHRAAAGGSAPAGVERDALVWTMLRLRGSRASVTTTDLQLESPRLTVLPGPTGEMASITADGGASELRLSSSLSGQATGKSGPQGATFRSPRPIHLAHVAASLGALHRRYGFPAYALGPLQDLEIVTFEGGADVDAGDGLHVAADQGLHLFRQHATAADGSLVARGFGNVVIARGEGNDRIEARGDHGFVLWRRPRGDELVLGDDDPRAAQSFALMRGGQQLNGRGACRVERAADGSITVHCAGEQPTIAGEFAGAAGDWSARLSSVRTLDATVRGETVLSLLATGDALGVDAERGGHQLAAKCARLEQTAANSWRLSGGSAPASLQLPADATGRGGELTAPAIDLHRIAVQSLLVDAVADATQPARLDARMPAESVGVAAATLRLDARRVRMLPFAVGPAAVPRRLLGLSPALADVVASSMAQPWLLAEGAVTADLVDAALGNLHGEGELLAGSKGARALLFLGDAGTGRPAQLRRLEGGEPTMIAEGPRVRCTIDDKRITVLTTFPGQSRTVTPRVTFRAAPVAAASTAGAAGPPARANWIRGECHGEVDVLRDAVLFRGPVTATSLLPSGGEDPDGMHIAAQKLRMERDAETGQLTRVLAEGGVTCNWRQLHARSQTVELDLKWQRCIATDPDVATIRFGSGRSYEARHLEANYATYAVTVWQGRLIRDTEPTARR